MESLTVDFLLTLVLDVKLMLTIYDMSNGDDMELVFYFSSPDTLLLGGNSSFPPKNSQNHFYI